MSQLFASGSQNTGVFSFNISPSSEHPGPISLRKDWLDLLAVQGTHKSLLQHHSSKASILWCTAFFIVQLSHPYMTTGKTIALTRWAFVDKVMSLLFSMLSRLVITFLVPNTWRKEDREEGSWDGDYKETDFFFLLHDISSTIYLQFFPWTRIICFCLRSVFTAAHRLPLAVAGGGGSVVVPRLLIALASLLVVLGGGSVAVAQGLSCIVACGSFLGQRWDQCPLHLQEDVCFLYHQESPQFFPFLTKVTNKPDGLLYCLDLLLND